MISEELLRQKEERDNFWNTAELVARNYLGTFANSNSRAEPVDAITISNDSRSECFSFAENEPEYPKAWNDLVNWSDHILRAALPKRGQLHEAVWILSHQKQLTRARNREDSNNLLN